MVLLADLIDRLILLFGSWLHIHVLADFDDRLLKILFILIAFDSEVGNEYLIVNEFVLRHSVTVNALLENSQGFFLAVLIHHIQSRVRPVLRNLDLIEESL